LQNKLNEGSEYFHEATADLMEQCGELYSRSKRIAAEAEKMFSKAVSR
jgi:hypothetical protein